MSIKARVAINKVSLGIEPGRLLISVGGSFLNFTTHFAEFPNPKTKTHNPQKKLSTHSTHKTRHPTHLIFRTKWVRAPYMEGVFHVPFKFLQVFSEYLTKFGLNGL
jgi:hypothetical protein